jgi:hypothetical protein
MQFKSGKLFAQSITSHEDSIWAIGVTSAFKFNTVGMDLNKMHLYDSALKVINVASEDEDNIVKKWENFYDFWASRMPADSLAKSYTPIAAYLKAIVKISTCDINDCGVNEFRGNWSNFGPENPPFDQKINGSIQKAGWITAIWSNPDPIINNQEIIAGGNGGLFKTIDEGATWVCLTQQLCNFGGLKIEDIAVDPFNKDNIYFSATLPNWDFNSAFMGSGIWHSIDGGLNWDIESNFPASMNITEPFTYYANKLKFCPYLVNGNTQSMIVASVSDNILTSLSSTWTLSKNGVNICTSPPINNLNPIFVPSNRLISKLNGNSNWVDLTATTNGFPMLPNATQGTIGDIDFPNDGTNKGNIIISTNWGGGDNPCFDRGVCIYRNKFDLITGLGITTEIMFDHFFNNMPFQAGATSSNTVNDDLISFYSTEYLANGECYTIASSRSNANNPPYYSLFSVFSWNMNSSAPCTTVNWIKTGFQIPGAYIFGAASFEKNPNNDYVFYLTQIGSGGQPAILFNNNSSWQVTGFNGINANDFHSDIRAIYVAKGTTLSTATTKPWEDDIVF